MFIPRTSQSSSFPSPGDRRKGTGKAERDSFPFQAEHNTHPHPTHNLRSVPHPPPKPAEPGTARCSHLPSLQGTEPSLNAQVVLGGHPGMLPTHPALPLRNGMEREEATLRSVSGIPRARTRSLRYVYKNMYVFPLYLYFFPSSSSFFQKETDIFGQSPAETSVIPRVALQKGASSCSFRAFNPSLPGDGRDGREVTEAGQGVDCLRKGRRHWERDFELICGGFFFLVESIQNCV